MWDMLVVHIQSGASMMMNKEMAGQALICPYGRHYQNCHSLYMGVRTPLHRAWFALDNYNR
jgi:hypothetical protein